MTTNESPVVEIHVESPSPIFFEVPNPNNDDTPEENPTWAEILQATVGKTE